MINTEYNHTSEVPIQCISVFPSEVQYTTVLTNAFLYVTLTTDSIRHCSVTAWAFVVGEYLYISRMSLGMRAEDEKLCLKLHVPTPSKEWKGLETSLYYVAL